MLLQTCRPKEAKPSKFGFMLATCTVLSLSLNSSRQMFTTDLTNGLGLRHMSGSMMSSPLSWGTLLGWLCMCICIYTYITQTSVGFLRHGTPTSTQNQQLDRTCRLGLPFGHGRVNRKLSFQNRPLPNIPGLWLGWKCDPKPVLVECSLQ